MTIPDFLPQIIKGTGETPKEGGCLIQVCSWLNDGHSWTDSTPCVHPVLRSVAIRVNDTVDNEDRQRLLLLAPRLLGSGMTGDAAEDKRVSVGLAIWFARQVLHLTLPQDRKVCERAISAAEAWIKNPSAAATATAAAADAVTAIGINLTDTGSGAAYSTAATAAAAATAYSATAAAAATAYSATAATAYSATAATAAAGAAYSTAATAAAAGGGAKIQMFTSLIDEYDRLTGRQITGATVAEADWARLAAAMAH